MGVDAIPDTALPETGLMTIWAGAASVGAAMTRMARIIRCMMMTPEN
jgi:hypothetical protein